MDNKFFERLEHKDKCFIDGVKNADAIILMASNDIHAYQKVAPKADVLCIPHGVDTSFFSREKVRRANKNKKERKQVLTVGNWLRDYGFWTEVVKEALIKYDDIEFTVITGDIAQKTIKEAFHGAIPSRVRILSGISDLSLREEYVNADLLFLPLIEAWANNALLEASSMGVPVMATDLPAVREYLSDELSICFTNDSASAVADQLINVLSDVASLKRRSKALRLRMENDFSWDTIVDRHLDLYKKLLESE